MLNPFGIGVEKNYKCVGTVDYVDEEVHDEWRGHIFTDALGRELHIKYDEENDEYKLLVDVIDSDELRK